MYMAQGDAGRRRIAGGMLACCFSHSRALPNHGMSNIFQLLHMVRNMWRMSSSGSAPNLLQNDKKLDANSTPSQKEIKGFKVNIISARPRREARRVLDERLGSRVSRI